MTQYSFFTSQIEDHIKWRCLTFSEEIWTRYDSRILTNYYQIQGIHENGTKGEPGQIQLNGRYIFQVVHVNVQ